MPLHLRGHLKKWRGTIRNFSGALRRAGVPTIRSDTTANGVYPSTVKQRWTIILRSIIIVYVILTEGFFGSPAVKVKYVTTVRLRQPVPSF